MHRRRELEEKKDRLISLPSQPACPTSGTAHTMGGAYPVCLSVSHTKQGAPEGRDVPGHSPLQPSAWRLVRAQQRPADGLTTGHQRLFSVTAPHSVTPAFRTPAIILSHSPHSGTPAFRTPVTILSRSPPFCGPCFQGVSDHPQSQPPILWPLLSGHQ